MIFSSLLQDSYPLPIWILFVLIILREFIYLNRDHFYFWNIMFMIILTWSISQVDDTDCMLLLITLFGEIILFFSSLNHLIWVAIILVRIESYFLPIRGVPTHLNFLEASFYYFLKPLSYVLIFLNCIIQFSELILAFFRYSALEPRPSFIRQCLFGVLSVPSWWTPRRSGVIVGGRMLILLMQCRFHWTHRKTRRNDLCRPLCLVNMIHQVWLLFDLVFDLLCKLGILDLIRPHQHLVNILWYLSILVLESWDWVLQLHILFANERVRWS